MMLTGVEKDIVRAWSAVVAGGGKGNAWEVQRQLAKGGTLALVVDLTRRLRELEMKGALPR